MANNVLLKIMDNNMLTGPNLKDWLRNLIIVLDFERIAYVLEAPPPLDIGPDAPQSELNAFEKWQEDSRRPRNYMLASMNRELQTKHEKVSNAYDILTALQEFYSENPRVVEYELCASLISMKLREGVPPDDHTIKLINGLGRLDGYGVIMLDCLKVNLILQSLPSSYKPFITNYNFNRIERNLSKLLNELQEFHR
ncbi:uncharacterized protein LOC116118086 [Pistacia vera]|uniref:uncharacterized protein LOC116118086 n=1 Tax=Pistacia vera TaxID=55513 RepID=UPI0012634249|nr:uncharacterized protein LOC116118086 [Pistacia vera]